MKVIPTILAIESSTSACSVALNVGDNVFERFELGNNIHSKMLLSMVDQVLAESQITQSDINAVAVGKGPGSFTGLRIGIGVAQGIAYGIGCSMLGLSSLEALAANTNMNGYVLAGIDARMNEIYWAIYKVSGDETQLCGSLSVSSPKLMTEQTLFPEGLDLDKDKLFLAGNAWSEYRDQIDQSFINKAELLTDRIYPQARDILLLAQSSYTREEFIASCDFAPEYVRNNVAEKKLT